MTEMNSHHHHPKPPLSLFAMAAWQRLALATLALAGLWSLVFWALGAGA